MRRPEIKRPNNLLKKAPHPVNTTKSFSFFQPRPSPAFSKDWVEDAVAWYNQRGECSENGSRGLRSDLAGSGCPVSNSRPMPCSLKLEPLSVTCFGCLIWRCSPPSWHRHQVQAIRWRLSQAAGKIVFHWGQVFLKVRRGLCLTLLLTFSSGYRRMPLCELKRKNIASYTLQRWRYLRTTCWAAITGMKRWGWDVMSQERHWLLISESFFHPETARHTGFYEINVGF